MWTQYLRKAAGVGVTWSVLFAAIFAAIAIVVGIVRPQDIDEGEGPLGFGAIGALVGFISGIGFSILVSAVERGRAIRDIALFRGALWGILASAVFPLTTGKEDQVIFLCPIGALVAMATVLIARQSTRPSSVHAAI